MNEWEVVCGVNSRCPIIRLLVPGGWIYSDGDLTWRLFIPSSLNNQAGNIDAKPVLHCACHKGKLTRMDANADDVVFKCPKCSSITWLGYQ